jgi:hypothetical protein
MRTNVLFEVNFMTHIPIEANTLFESGIYLPMLLIIVNHDIEKIEQGEFKLKGPYLHMLEGIRLQLEHDLADTKQQFKQCKMKLKRGVQDQLFTEYYFYFEEIVELRRYSNIRLRNQSEYLLEQYMHQHLIK